MDPHQLDMVINVGTMATVGISTAMTVSLFYGIYLCQSALALYIIWKRVKEADRKIGQFIVLMFLIFCSTTGLFAMIVANLFAPYSFIWYSPEKIPDSIEEIMEEISRKASWYHLWQSIFMAFILLCGGAIVAIRAAKIWNHSRCVRILLAISWLGSLSTSLYSIVIIAQDLPNPTFLAKMATLAIPTFVSAGVNALSSILIGIRAWNFRKMIQGFESTRKPTTHKILYFLIECGIFYSGLQILCGVLLLRDQKITKSNVSMSNMTMYVIDSICAMMFGMYPCLVIIIVASKHSVIDIIPFGLEPRHQQDFGFANASAGTHIELYSMNGQSAQT